MSREGSSTPSAFNAQNTTAEDLLKTQTVGLVSLNDYRKRHAEAREAKDREAEARIQSGYNTSRSGSATPSDGVTASQPPAKKKRKAAPKSKLSFGLMEEVEDSSAIPTPRGHTPVYSTPAQRTRDGTPADDEEEAPAQRKLGPNLSLANAPKILTKMAKQKEALQREQLRKEFLLMQEAVKSEEILIPFVFYDGSNIPGGAGRVKKGDHIWLFLDRARKVGAETGAGGGDKSRREWARVGVDDLMLVKGEIIIPHHYDFHYFILNKIEGFNGPIFKYSDKPTASGASSGLDITTADSEAGYDPLSRPGTDRPKMRDEDLEGFGDDPNATKVVDRRWYEKNKHIFPASVWEEFDPKKDYKADIRKDQEGNKFFFT